MSSNKNLKEHFEDELNHDEPPWRTLVAKEWWRMKRIRIRPCDDFDGGTDEIAGKTWTPEKKGWKYLGLEFIQREQTPKEGINQLEE